MLLPLLANSSLLGGGGVDGCIHRAAGHLLKEECRTLNGCETGKAKISCGYRLPAKSPGHFHMAYLVPENSEISREDAVFRDNCLLVRFRCFPEQDVIHTVGPVAQGEPSATQEAELSNCYKSSLKLVVENKLRTVAFPCISTGVFGYPNEAAAKVVLNTLRKWLEENKEKVDRIILCVFLDTDEMIYKEKLPEFFPIDACGDLHSHL